MGGARSHKGARAGKARTKERQAYRPAYTNEDDMENLSRKVGDNWHPEITKDPARVVCAASKRRCRFASMVPLQPCPSYQIKIQSLESL
jgi:hypothetical protein